MKIRFARQVELSTTTELQGKPYTFSNLVFADCDYRVDKLVDNHGRVDIHFLDQSVAYFVEKDLFQEVKE